MISSEDFGVGDARVDSYEEDATRRLKRFFQKHRNSVFDTKQVQILFEPHYFHWITYRALANLEHSGLINVERHTFDGASADIRYHRANRYYKRKAKQLMRLIRAYSNETVSRACGQEANNQFELALHERQFKFIAKNARTYKRKRWDRTQHDLDLILAKGKETFGIEIKNTFDYIDRNEMNIKIDICRFLGLKPVFIVRAAPQNYINIVNKAGGFTLVFETKIFPIALKDLAQRINSEKFSPYLQDELVQKNGRVRKLCDAPMGIPSGIIDRLVRWAERL